MMRSCLLLFGGICMAAALAQPASSAAREPLIVLSLASPRDVVGNVAPLGEVAEAGGLPAWLGPMLKLYAAGNGAQGLDPARPWGAAVYLEGSKLCAFGFLPVRDPEQLASELGEHIARTTERGGGVYLVEGKRPGERLFAKLTGSGYVIVSDSEATLALAPADPARLAAGLDKQYDLALRLQVQSIPKESGRQALALLRSEIERRSAGIGRRIPAPHAAFLLHAVENLHDVTLGWSRHAAGS